MECLVNFMWDHEASVWIATSEDVPGLVLESGSYDTLIERVKNAIPELMELNGNHFTSICFRSERHQKVLGNG